MFFKIRVNMAIARLGIDPRAVRSEYRTGLAGVGRLSGNSPQEVALYAVAQMPLVYRMNLNTSIVKDWVRKRKIDPQSAEMREALSTLDLWEFLGVRIL